VVGTAVALLAATVGVPAAQGVAPMPVTATFVVEQRVALTLSSATLTFPDANPETQPQLGALEGPLTIRARAAGQPGTTAVLTLQASDDLRSGLDVIPAGAITWTASGPGFVPGTLSSTTAQTVGTWATPGQHVGAQTFLLANSWQYAVGSYSVRLTYTLVTP
jgi:hypothetical protein